MIQKNSLEGDTWRNFKNKADNIDKLVEWALEKQSQRISDKYSNISNTVKILKNLMIQFTKKADNLEKHLITVSRVEETKFQTIYYQQRINECLELSQKLREQTQIKNKNINDQEKQINELRKKLIKLKTDNIKIAMKMENIEQNYLNEEEKQNVQAEKERKKMKIQEMTGLISKNSNVKVQKNSLKEQSIKLELQLLRKIEKVNQLKKLIESSFDLLRQKLKKQQKKSNLYGLAGSMLFKLENKNDLLVPNTKKRGDSKLIIYDVLKEKYKKHIKSQSKKQEELGISLEEFMKFSPLQIMGVIELKGGLKNIISKKYEQHSSSPKVDLNTQTIDRVKQNSQVTVEQ